MNSVVFGSGSPFIIFHFAQRASQTSAAACHVKTLYQALTAPHTHTVRRRTHGSYTLDLRSAPPTCAPTYVGTYVVICLTTAALSATLCSACRLLIPRSPLISHLVSEPVLPFSHPLPRFELTHTSAFAALMLVWRKKSLDSRKPISFWVKSSLAAKVTVRSDT